VRFNSKKGYPPLSIQFEVSQDPEHLEQYYSLRQRCFRRELDLPDFDGTEEEQDRHGHILLALYDGQCIGGARISRHVTWTSQMGTLGLEAESCCMWERFAIDPRVRTLQMFQEFCANLITASLQAGYRHAMVLSSMRNARFYRRCHSALGVDFRIHRQVPHLAQGIFAGLEHYLSVSYLEDAAPLQIAI